MSDVKIHSVSVQVRPPKNGDQGQVAEGRYTVVDNVVTLVDHEGVPATDEKGRKYSQKLCDGEHHKAIAGRLTRQLRAALRGVGPTQGFAGPIAYPKIKRA